MKRLWLVVLLPAVLGLGLGGLAATGVTNNALLYVKADLAAIFSRGGILISLIGTGFLYLWLRSRANTQQTLNEFHRQNAEDRRRFLQRLDHELKNPLTAIQAGLVNLAEATEENARKERLTSVQAQTLRISRLVADLQKLVALETNPVEKTEVDLAELLQDVVKIANERPEIEERRLTLSLPRAPWPLPKVSGDPDLLFLAAHNLVDNAIKFTESGDTVEIRAYEDGTSVVVEIADTGQGIPQDEIVHVWDELYRGVSARGIPGSGLGLSLVRAIVERHGGNTSLRSRPGLGTVFAFSLPVQG